MKPINPRLAVLAAALVLVAIAAGRPLHAPKASAANGAWTGEYFNNLTLSGAAVLSRTESGTGTQCDTAPLPGLLPALDCFWTGSPGGTVLADGFSARWQRTETFVAGTYRFTGTSDDGMRIYVDNVIVVDAWFNQPPTTYYSDKVLTPGSHTVKVEYYDADNGATAQVSVQDVATLPTAWAGQYYANQNLTGSPALTRNDADIDFDWNLSSPAPGVIPVDHFSARWTQTLPFNDGVYSFTTTSDDGARVYVDGQLVLNFWVDQGGVTHVVNKQMTAGNHTVVVEFYENAGGASMVFDLAYRPDLGGFVTDSTVTGLTLPTVFAFAPDGRIFIGLKDGTIRIFKNGALLATPYYTVTNLNNYADRGLVGMTLDPTFATNGYVYVAYTYDPKPSDISGPKNAQVIRINATTPSGDVANPASKFVVLGSAVGVAATPSCDIPVTGVNTSGLWTTSMPHQLAVGQTITLASAITAAVPPLPAGNYVVSQVQSSTTFKVTGVVSLTSAGGSGSITKTDSDCIPSDGLSHSIGNLRFGPDGMLYVATGDGASYSSVDPLALRAQNIDRLSGKILRVNPANGQGLATNPFTVCNPTCNLAATRSKVWAYGVRNDFRFNFKPGTNVIFSGDVGWDSQEEVNVITPGVNLGWPCYEGNPQQPGYGAFPLCQSLYAAGGTTFGIYTWDHSAGTAASVGGAFSGDASSVPPNTYNAAYQNTYWFADYSVNKISTLKVDGSNHLVPGSVQVFSQQADGPVQLQTGPDGDIYYLAINAGELRHIRFVGDNRPPVAVTSATSPLFGPAPLTVNFSSAGSNDPDAGQTEQLAFDWDFGDGSAHSTLPNPVHQYLTTGNKTATLAVTDPFMLTATTTQIIQVGNTPPVATISSPVDLSHYDVGDVISFSGSATDLQDVTEPPSRLAWSVVLVHCSDATYTSCHTHPHYSKTGDSGEFTISDHGDFVYFEIFLTATDAGGLTDTELVTIHANTVDITFSSDRAGTQLVVDGTSQTAPFTHSVPRKSAHVIFAPSPQTIAGGPVYFMTWSDSGEQQHTVIATAAATYTAHFIDPTATSTNTPPSTSTPTSTATPTPTNTPVPTSTSTYTPTSTATATSTPSPTKTSTSTATPTHPANQPPTVGVSGIAPPITGAPGLLVSLTAQFGDVDADALSYAIAWGDGTSSVAGGLASPYGAVPASHTYAWAGTYTLRVSATDLKHPTVAQTFSVTVGPPVDADLDGMADDYEVAHPCLVLGTNDGAVDFDLDGLTNVEEYQRGTNPCIADSDGDGYNDGQEWALSAGAGGMVYCGIMRADVQPSPTGDGRVGILDMAQLSGDFLKSVPPASARLDQDGDNHISILDLATMSQYFLKSIDSCV